MHPNVYTVLHDNNIPHQEIRHDSFSTPINSPVDFANAVNYELSRITKSVFLRSKQKDKYIMAVCSMGKKIDFARLAALAGVTKLEVAEKQELADKIGYPVNGVCSIGISPDIPIFIDKALTSFPTILIGSGEAAVEIELSPAALVTLSKATVDQIILE
ncbi:MAG: YbaK/EbsC family protein [Niabella sp.]|nr:YbaK/EbsC family protein [Niabella sp.]